MEIKISFGIIVLNGMPFVKYLLRQLYPHAHEIIIVEGASKFASDVSTKDGHSTDGTLEAIEEFKKDEDPEHKIKLITKNGFWSEKDEQSQAYAKAATGNFLWQVDIDEFYKDEDVNKVKQLLAENQNIDTISFKMITFWGGFDYLCDGWFLKKGKDEFHRLFKWNSNYEYQTHRPPTVIDENKNDLRNKNWIRANELNSKYGIKLYHYSLVFPHQVETKTNYYEQVFYKGFLNWLENSYRKLKNPYRVHNKFEYPSWLFRFKGEHPTEIQKLIEDLKSNNITVNQRDNTDVEKIIDNPIYRINSFFLKLLYYPYIFFTNIRILLGKVYYSFKNGKD